MMISGERKLAQAELMANAARAAGGFAKLGLTEGDAVALMLRNDFAFFEAAIGAAISGAYAVPINWHFTEDEACYVIADCGAKVLLVHADLLPAIEKGIPQGVHVLVVPTPPEIAAAYGVAPEYCTVPTGRTNWDDWLPQQPAWGEPPRRARTNMIYTSGTTGRPKGVRREPQTPEMQAAMGAMVSQIFDIRPGEKMRTVVTGPVYHSAPNLYALQAAQSGGLVILQPRFEPEELLRMVEENKITHLHMVPTMFNRLLKLPQETREKYDLSSLKFVVHAAAPCSPHVKRGMIEWRGPIINEYYGGTETGGVTFHTAQEAIAKPGTVGRPIQNGVVKLFKADGTEAPQGEVGEVYLRIRGFPDFTYNGLDDKRREVGREDLVTIGDVGFIDPEGYLFLCDRVRDMIISGGVNIYPAEIESTLITMPGLRDCAVFGIPDDEFGESVCAYVEPQDDVTLTAEDVRGFLRGKVANYKIPKVVEIVSSLPREDSGKIFKRKLRAPYWEEAGRQI
ncbi:acyl-CoA synthetase [Variibacter gotjawalensis]|uniref:acyl-CoA synthetase n=1 Tax=Variibacter gotjawalensis TaxID=1333996 RepID=UPI000BBB3554|nr:acyl-CoA synthetase [Variibacter gotjawalensis]